MIVSGSGWRVTGSDGRGTVASGSRAAGSCLRNIPSSCSKKLGTQASGLRGQSVKVMIQRTNVNLVVVHRGRGGDGLLGAETPALFAGGDVHGIHRTIH